MRLRESAKPRATKKRKTVVWPKCAWCRRPAEPANLRLDPKDRSRTTLCPHCVRLALCRMTIVAHGLCLLDGRAESNRYQGHDRRFLEHETRILEGMTS
jgi:hypothetical protein